MSGLASSAKVLRTEERAAGASLLFYLSRCPNASRQKATAATMVGGGVGFVFTSAEVAFRPFSSICESFLWALLLWRADGRTDGGGLLPALTLH